MNTRRMALGVATMSITAAVGLGTTASPAMAMPNDCKRIAAANARALSYMDEATSVEVWLAAFNLYLVSADYLNEYC